MPNPTFRSRDMIKVGLGDFTSDDFRNWSKRKLLNIPPAVEGYGAAQRFGLANAYEILILSKLSELGLNLELASNMLRKRFEKIGRKRAKELGKRWPGLRAFVDDPNTWLNGTELDTRQNAVWFTLNTLFDNLAEFVTEEEVGSDLEGEPLSVRIQVYHYVRCVNATITGEAEIDWENLDAV